MARSRKSIDWIMLGVLFCLMAIGTMLVYTATVGEPGFYWQKQMMYNDLMIVKMHGCACVQLFFSIRVFSRNDS